MPAPRKSPTSNKQEGIEQVDIKLPTLGTDELPLLLRDDQMRVSAGIKLESMQMDGSKLHLTGWTLGSQRLVLLCDNKRLATRIKHVPRVDVVQALQAVCDFDPGFELTATLPRSGTLVLRWLLEMNNKLQPIDFLLDTKSLAGSAPVKESAPVSPAVVNHPTVGTVAPSFGDIECAFPLGNGLMLLGWLEEKQFSNAKLHIHRSKSEIDTFPLSGGKHSRISRVFRPDILELLGMPNDQRPSLGFAAWVPLRVQQGEKVGVGFGKSLAKTKSLPLLTCNDCSPAQEKILALCGFDLAELADSLRDEEWLSWLESRGYSLQEPSDARFGALHQAYVIGGRTLLLHGWIAAGNANIETLTLKRANGKHSINLASRLQRIYRPDLFAAYPQLAGESLGFLALVDEPELVTLEPLQLMLRTGEGRNLITFTPEALNVTDLFKLLTSTPALIDPITNLVQSVPALHTTPGLSRRFPQFLRHNFRARNASQPTHINDPNTLVANLDRVFNLEDAGLLLFGWYVATGKKLVSVTLHGPEGLLADITGSMFPLMRQDAAATLISKYPGVNDYCGFCCHIPVATKPGDVRSLKFLLEDNIATWLRVDCAKPDKEYLELAREIVSHIPNIDKITRPLFNLYQTTLGESLKALVRRKRTPRKPQQHYAIGVQPAKPVVSLIRVCSDPVLLRQFCCHIAKDQNIKHTELILVCTNAAAANEIAATVRYCCNLFDLSALVLASLVPMETVEACNAGAALATAPLLMFVDEGVIACSDKLIGTLKSRLDNQKTLAAIGAHGLLFDGSPVNFGTVGSESPELPGFIFPRPRYAKPRATGTSGVLPTDLLLSPCRVVRKSSFAEAGGLDVCFFNIDFAWHALSAKLSETGKTLAIDTDAAVWQLNPAPPSSGPVRNLKDLLYYFDAWLATGALSKNIHPVLGI